IAREGNRARRYREANDSARSGNFRDGVAVSCAGVCTWISLVTVDGLAPSGCAEHPGAFDDAHGYAVLVRGIGGSCRRESSHAGRRISCRGDCGYGYAAALDDASAEVFALAD